MRIGLLSDTHGYIDDRILSHLQSCDEIWHAGDIGSSEVTDSLSKLKPLRAVHGNIDGQPLRSVFLADQSFDCEGLRVLITHIGGYPGNYSPDARKKIEELRPGLFICGHSHILKVINDRKYNLLHINPGAAGIYGFHKMRTMVRFTVSGGRPSGLEVIELGPRSVAGITG